MPEQNYIIEKFEEYVNQVYPEGADEEKRKQLKMAWFASAFVVLSRLVHVTLQGTDEEASVHVRALMDEAVSWCGKRAEEARKILESKKDKETTDPFAC